MRGSSLFTALALLISALVSFPASSEVRILSGGVGKEEEKFFAGAESGYNVRLVLVGGARGAYLSDVLVRFIDHDGNVVGRAVSDGPILLAALPPGAYRAEGIFGGETLTQRIRAPQQGWREYYLRFKTGDD